MVKKGMAGCCADAEADDVEDELDEDLEDRLIFDTKAAEEEEVEDGAEERKDGDDARTGEVPIHGDRC